MHMSRTGVDNVLDVRAAAEVFQYECKCKPANLNSASRRGPLETLHDN